MRKAVEVVGTSEATINHSENGRRGLKPDYILKAVTVYGYTYGDFLDFVQEKREAPERTLSECIAILRRLKPEKLRSEKVILESL